MSSRSGKGKKYSWSGRRSRPLLEFLERRRLMTDVPLYSVSPDGLLAIHGTPGDDQIRFYTIQNADGTGYLDNPGLLLNGVETTLDGAIRVKRVVIDAGDGNDVVDLGEGKWPRSWYFGRYLPATIAGGDGDDLLIGGAADDVVHGDAGNDTLVGGPGHDTLAGDGGDDVIYGGMGDDRLLGGPGVDQLYGVPSDDDTGDETEDALRSLAWLDADGILQVRGTPGDDYIALDVSLGQTNSIPPHFFGGLEVSVNGEVISFSFGIVPIRGINIVAGAGDDQVWDGMPVGAYAGISSTGPRPVAAPLLVTIDGGDGDDSLMYQTSMYDAITLVGGAGNDTLNGSAATDRLELAPMSGKIEITPANPEPQYFSEDGKVVACLDSDGTLTLYGSDADDVISVDHPASGEYVGGPPVVATVNGWTHTFGMSPLFGRPVTRIVVEAGGGNDSVTVGEAITLPASLNGGAGDDTLTGGGGNDTLVGGPGDDVADGRGGLDEIVGKSGPVDARREGGSSSSGTLVVRGTAGDDHIQVLGWGFRLIPGQPLSASGLQLPAAGDPVLSVGGPFVVRIGDSEKEFGTGNSSGRWPSTAGRGTTRSSTRITPTPARRSSAGRGTTRSTGTAASIVSSTSGVGSTGRRTRARCRRC